jgi:hypothetical protein
MKYAYIVKSDISGHGVRGGTLGVHGSLSKAIRHYKSCKDSRKNSRMFWEQYHELCDTNNRVVESMWSSGQHQEELSVERWEVR